MSRDIPAGHDESSGRELCAFSLPNARCALHSERCWPPGKARRRVLQPKAVIKHLEEMGGLDRHGCSWLHGDMHGSYAPWPLLRRSKSILDCSARLSSAL